MPDAADSACVHLIKTLDRNDTSEQLEYICMDCGQVGAAISLVEASGYRLEAWYGRNGIPQRAVSSAVRRGVVTATT